MSPSPPWEIPHNYVPCGFRDQRRWIPERDIFVTHLSATARRRRVVVLTDRVLLSIRVGGSNKIVDEERCGAVQQRRFRRNAETEELGRVAVKIPLGLLDGAPFARRLSSHPTAVSSSSLLRPPASQQ